MSLELTGTIVVDVIKHVAKKNKKDDGNTSYVTVEMDLTEDGAGAIGGKLFADGLFCAFVGKSGEALLGSAEPGRALTIKADHNLTVESYTVQTKPKITGLHLSTKERRATVTMVLSISHTNKKLCHRMLDLVGSAIAIEFGGVVQPELPGANGEDKRHGFEKAKGKKAKAKANGNGNGQHAEPEEPEEMDEVEAAEVYGENAPGGRPEPMFDDDGNEVHA
jgi:hypothetical protein